MAHDLGDPLLGRLRDLYISARRPTYRALEMHADLAGHTLRTSTISDLLNGRVRPRWDTVEAFVQACTEHARAHHVALDEQLSDLDRWHRAMEDSPTERAGPTRRKQPTLPAQLPPDVPAFVGRPGQLTELDGLLSDRDAPVIVVIDGSPGVGKSTLAVHWAHQVAVRFPDGQLYADLRGFDSESHAQDPGSALRGFLDALDVPLHRIPPDVHDKAALFRSLLAGRRMLLLLDNARDSGQVRPLLPGSAGCAVVVTSRHKLTSLVAGHGARPVSLDLMTAADSWDLLSTRLGAAALTAEPDAAAVIVDRCARLPLALVLAAARAATRPHLSLAALAGHLSDGTSGLAVLSGDEAANDIRAVFASSYRALSEAAARMFRLFGLHPSLDVSVPAAAAAAGVPAAAARTALDELADAQLLTERVAGRYGCHDLLREYARQLATAEDRPGSRRAAQHRMLDYYLHTADRADRALASGRPRIQILPARSGSRPTALGGETEALVWLTIEHKALLGAVALAEREGFDRHVWQIMWTLETYLQRCGHWLDQVTGQHRALSAARRLGDPAAQGHAYRALGNAYARLDDSGQAQVHYCEAFRLLAQVGDRVALGRMRLNFGLLAEQRGDHAATLRHVRRALLLFERAGDGPGRASALNMIGFTHALTGDYPAALDHCRRSLRLQEEIGYLRDQASTWGSLGYINIKMGAYAEALSCYRNALDLARRQRDPLDEARALDGLGDVHCAIDAPAAATSHWRAALDILDNLGHAAADQIRGKLGSPPAPESG